MNLVHNLELILVASVLHELGHILTATALGVKVKRFGISWKGPYIVRESGTPNQNLLITLAGPTVNLLLCLTMWGGLAMFGQLNLILGIINLLPWPSCSDGARAYRLIARHDQPTT